MRSSLMPIACAASTNGSSRSASVLARMTRATYGISGMAIAMIVFVERGPERGRHHQRQNQQRQRLQNIDDALRDEIDPAAEIAGSRPITTPSDAAEQRRADADRERDARAVDDAAVDVAAHEIGSPANARRSAAPSDSARVGRQRIVDGDETANNAAKTNTAMMIAPAAPSG